MFEVRLSYVLSSFVDQFLIRESEHIFSKGKTVKQPGIKLHLKLGLRHVDTTESRYVHVLFSGGTSVWVNEVDVLSRTPDIDGWNNIGNHDSCWRDVLNDYLTNVYLALSEQVNSEFEEDVAASNMDNVAFFVNLRPFEWVYVTHKPDERRSEEESNFRTVVKVEPAKPVFDLVSL
jgi:hypothetical protein